MSSDIKWPKWYQWFNLLWAVPAILLIALLGLILYVVTRPLPQKYRNKAADFLRRVGGTERITDLTGASKKEKNR